MIVGIVSAHRHELADRTIRTLSGKNPATSRAWRNDGEPQVWLTGALSSSGRGPARISPSAPPVVAFDGALYDASEAKSLAGTAGQAATTDPADLIASLWQATGPPVLTRIVADFSLAVWDHATRSLVLAVDPMGVWPLYYAESADRSMLAFASRTQVLRALEWVGSEPDDEAVVAMLLNRPSRSDATYYRDIRVLPGGHLLRWREGRVHVERYWGPHFAAPEVRNVNEMLEAFEHTVRVAVAARLDPARPTAILMSGGYDSTAVAGAVAALGRERPAATPPIVAISAAFGDLPCDESARIDIALAETGLSGLRADPLGKGVDVESMRKHVELHDAPIVDFQSPLFDACTTLARHRGCVALMMGMGGDELATDFDYHFDLAREMGVWRFPATVRRVAAIERWSTWNTARWLARELCPESVKRPYRALRRAMTPMTRSDAPQDWLTPHARLVAKGEPALYQQAPVGYGSQTDEARWRAVTSPSIQATRRWFTVEMAARGFALANPLLDRRLFELVLGTPARHHPRSFDHGEFKPLIARGLPFVPRPLVAGYWKVAFGSYNAHVIRHSLDAIERWLFGSSEWRAERFVTREAAVRTLQRFRDEPVRTHYKVETIVGLETWMRAIGHHATPREGQR